MVQPEVAASLGYEGGARSAAAGLLRREEGDAPRNVMAFVGWSLLGRHLAHSGLEVDLQAALLEEMRLAPPGFSVVCSSWDDTVAEVQRRMAAHHSGSDSSGWVTDGVVVKLASRELARAAGATLHHPRHQMALKWSVPHAQLVQGRLGEILWTADRRAVLRPVGLLAEAVPVGGAQVSRVALHNWDTVRRHCLTVGSPLALERAGSTVPHAVFDETPVREDDDPIAPPALCSCGAQGHIRLQDEDLVCLRSPCRGQQVAIAITVTKALAWKGLGPQLLRQAALVGLLDTPAFETPDAPGAMLWRLLDVSGDEWSTLPRVGEKRVAALVAQRNEVVDSAPRAAVLQALALPRLGRSAALALGQLSWDELLSDEPPLATRISGLGPDTGAALSRILPSIHQQLSHYGFKKALD